MADDISIHLRLALIKAAGRVTAGYMVGPRHQDSPTSLEWKTFIEASDFLREEWRKAKESK